MRPAIAYCSATGSSGVGATIWECPIFISPRRRAEDESTVGGGSTIAACGPRRVLDDSAFMSGAGATTFCESIADRSRLAGMVSGAGGTAVMESVGILKLEAAALVDARGTAGCDWLCDHATMLGIGTS